VPKHPAVTGFLALCLFHLTFWVNGPHVLRYMTPILPELSLASAYMLGCLTSAAMLKRLGGLGAATGRRVASVLVVIGLVVPTVAAAWASLDSRPWLPILGLESREAYLDRRLPNQRLVDYLNEQGDTVRGVLMIGDRRGFYVNAPTWLDISLGAFETLAEAPDADSAREYLASLGVSHVLVSEADIGWHAQWDPERKIRRWWTTFSRTRGRYLTEVERQDTTVLYRVREAPSP
jgi:hypothetical protein